MPTPILTPTASHPSKSLSAQTPQRPRPLSYSSVSSLASNATSIMMLPDGDVEEVTEEGVHHADLKLEARKYKTLPFRQALLQVLQTIRVPTWSSAALEPEHVQISKVSGALTNAVFFISYSGNAPPTSTSVPQSAASSAPHLTHHGSSYSQTSPPRTVLLRIYGPSSSTLISRPDELHTLHILSSVYRIGPRVFGTFQNGRIEEWFDSSALTSQDLRDPIQSRWIGMRMRELHSVDVLGVVGSTWNGQETVLKNVIAWRGPAKEVLDMLKAKEGKGEIGADHVWHGVREKLDLAEFARAWDAYWAWLQKWEEEYGRSEMVFAHNDTQYGNLLRWNKPSAGKPDHHRIIVVDFEYAAPNPAAFDIANHFHEWMADYHNPDASHVLTRSRYPTQGERWNFYCGYLTSPTLGGPLTASPAPTRQSSFYGNPSASSLNLNASNGNHRPKPSPSPVGTPVGSVEIEELMDALDAQVFAWSPASHAMWTIWGIVQASDDVTNGSISDFDYLGYATGRFEMFKEELAERGVEW
ncbi:choline kinase, cytoplasm [Ceratobasidium sp. AG-Ba]|nr:choline kinase, cytoplasm [Ceratobasidium sp. AG-Ba]